MASSNPFDSPLINPNYLSTDFDIFTIRESIKVATTFMAAPAWDEWILGEAGAFAQAKTDNEIEQNVRNTSSPGLHTCGTVGMGKTGSTGSGTGALNSDLTVKGIVGLRVVDASVFVSAYYHFFSKTVFNVYSFIHTTAVYPCSSYANANIYCGGACCRSNQTIMGVIQIKLIRK